MKAIKGLLLLLCLTACDSQPAPPKADSLAAYRGSWTLINYWAEWCAPCIEEIPELNAFDDTHPDIAVLGVNFDGATGAALAEQERKLGVEFPTLAQDPAAELGISRPAVLPTTLVVAPHGAVAATLLGPQTERSLGDALATARAESAGH